MDARQKVELLKKVEHAIDTVRPHLRVDGGDVEVIDITDDMVVRVKWLGACVGCGMAEMTLKGGLEYTVKNMVPEIQSVVASD